MIVLCRVVLYDFVHCLLLRRNNKYINVYVSYLFVCAFITYNKTLLCCYSLLNCDNDVFLQAMSILVVNQSVIDTLGSLLIPLSLIKTKETGLSSDSIYDQFLCIIVIPERPLWSLMILSTYGIVVMTLSRYVAVIHPLKYKDVRMCNAVTARSSSTVTCSGGSKKITLGAWLQSRGGVSSTVHHAMAYA